MLTKKFCSAYAVYRPGRGAALIFFITAAVILSVFSVCSSAQADDSYTIGAGDVLSITVYDHEELTSKLRVSEEGKIEFPLIGDVRVSGLKVSAAAKRIEKALGDGYIVDPQVSILIEQFNSQKIVVLGHVKNPGLMELRGPITLLELISQAGGLQKDAGDTVTVKRTVKGKQKIITVDLARLIETGDPQENIQIRGGDTVSVPQGAVCYITGGVKNPGAYPCGRNTNVLKIVSLAGSYTEKGVESGLKINRVVDGKKQVLRKVNESTRLLPDDVIVVPESITVKGKEPVCYITGAVARPGAYPCGRNATVLKMITRAGSFADNASQSGIQINRIINGRKTVLKNVDQNTSVRPEDIIVVPERPEPFVKKGKEAVCYITGQVKKPGAYPCGSTTNVLKMVSLAGGFTGIASESGISITRIIKGKKKVLKDVELDTSVRPEDVVVVPESFF
ncbi:MAG: SLBB domain-containing protein [Candidatus Electrothrix sp. YB6]